jgi:hypothetical protein
MLDWAKKGYSVVLNGIEVARDDSSQRRHSSQSWSIERRKQCA